MLVSFALGDANFLRGPCIFLFFCVDFFALGSKRKPNSQWNLGGVGVLRWACTFHASGDANSTQRNPVIWWNMGFIQTWGPSLNYVRTWGRGGGQVSHTFLLRITCKKGGRG